MVVLGVFVEGGTRDWRGRARIDEARAEPGRVVDPDRVIAGLADCGDLEQTGGVDGVFEADRGPVVAPDIRALEVQLRGRGCHHGIPVVDLHLGDAVTGELDRAEVLVVVHLDGAAGRCVVRPVSCLHGRDVEDVVTQRRVGERVEPECVRCRGLNSARRRVRERHGLALDRRIAEQGGLCEHAADRAVVGQHFIATAGGHPVGVEYGVDRHLTAVVEVAELEVAGVDLDHAVGLEIGREVDVPLRLLDAKPVAVLREAKAVVAATRRHYVGVGRRDIEADLLPAVDEVLVEVNIHASEGIGAAAARVRSGVHVELVFLGGDE